MVDLVVVDILAVAHGRGYVPAQLTNVVTLVWATTRDEGILPPAYWAHVYRHQQPTISFT